MNIVQTVVLNKFLADIESDKSFNQSLESLKDYFINLIKDSTVEIISTTYINLKLYYDKNIIPKIDTLVQENRLKDQFSKWIIDEGLDKFTIPGSLLKSYSNVRYIFYKVDITEANKKENEIAICYHIDAN